MTDDAVGHPHDPTEAIDLSVLERIEGELAAVERALEQVDQGIYEGFTGLGSGAVQAGGAPSAGDTEDSEGGPGAYG